VKVRIPSNNPKLEIGSSRTAPGRISRGVGAPKPAHMFDFDVFHPYRFVLNHRSRQNANEIPLFSLLSPSFSPLSPLPSFPQEGNQLAFSIISMTCAAKIPHPLLLDVSPLPPLNSANSDIVVGTSPVFKQAVLVEEDVTLNFFSFLFARSRARSFSSQSRLSTLDTFNFDPAEPPSTPSPQSSLRSHTSWFHHLSSVSPLRSQDDAFTLTAFGKTTQTRLISGTAKRISVDPDQGLTKWWRWHTPCQAPIFAE
jgi:hypothetical protein